MSKITRDILFKCVGKECVECNYKRACADANFDTQHSYSDIDRNNKCVKNTECYMAIAKSASLLSDDPNTKVGACVVDNKGNVLSIGYNHMPSDSFLYPWNRDGKAYETKYPYIIHAEMTCLLKANGRGNAIYTTHFPCSNCAKHIVESGVRKVVFIEYFRDSADIEISKNILSIEGIEVVKFSEISNLSSIEIDFTID